MATDAATDRRRDVAVAAPPRRASSVVVGVDSSSYAFGAVDEIKPARSSDMTDDACVRLWGVGVRVLDIPRGFDWRVRA